MEQSTHIQLEDDLKESVASLVKHRLPWLLVGLVGGLALPLVSSKFESLLSENIPLVFFIPIIVYMSDAVGTQSEAIYIRNSVKGKIKFPTYIFKEMIVGTFLGLAFGLTFGLFAFFWLKSITVATSVGLAMFVNMTLAPGVALLVARALQKEKKDPALGTGPFSTVLQDLISLSVYFIISSLIILSRN